jgi:DNA-binding transcriptional ArsR family regulator
VAGLTNTQAPGANVVDGPLTTFYCGQRPISHVAAGHSRPRRGTHGRGGALTAAAGHSRPPARAGIHQASSMYYFGVPVSPSPVPPVVQLLADPVRWRLMRELACGDRRVRELVVALGQPQSLISYHLRRLRAGGLVTARRSSFDARDTYYSLDLNGCPQALAAAFERTAAELDTRIRFLLPALHGAGLR